MYREYIVVRNVGNPEESSFASVPLLISLATHPECIFLRPEIEANADAAMLWVEGSRQGQYRFGAYLELGSCQASLPRDRFLAS